MQTGMERITSSNDSTKVVDSHLGRVATRRRRAERTIATHRQAGAQELLRVGVVLMAERKLSRAAAFWAWLEQIDMRRSEGNRYMRLAVAYGSKMHPAVASLSLDAIYKLAERDAEAVRVEVLRQADAGETLRSIEIIRIVNEAQQAAKADRARVKAEREASRRATLTTEQREAEDARRSETCTTQPRQVPLNDAAVDRAASSLLTWVRPDVLATLVSIAQDYGVAAPQVIAQAINMVVARSTPEERVIDLPVAEIDCGSNGDDPATADVMLAAAARYDAGDPVPPITARPNPSGRYDVVVGHETLQIVRDVLERPSIPARVIPSSDIETVGDGTPDG